MKTVKIPVIELSQNIGVFYIGKLNGNTLYKMAKSDIRAIVNETEYQGIQRQLEPSRVKKIKQYLEASYATLPNSIILNVNSEKIVSSDKNNLEVYISDTTFTIIDGQHRLSGFQNSDENLQSFELPVAIFIDLDISDQALIFSTINSEQKKVDPSLKFDLENYSRVDTPKKKISQLVYAFNNDRDSPWRGQIKLTGRKDINSPNAMITQKAFGDAIVKYLFDEVTDETKIRRILIEGGDLEEIQYDVNRYLFWDFYVNNKMDVLYKILLNYFNAFQTVFAKDWGDSKSILNKTTGYNAIMLLFKPIYLYCKENKSFTQERITAIISPLRTLDGTINTENYSGSGAASSAKLFDAMRSLIDIDASY